MDSNRFVRPASAANFNTNLDMYDDQPYEDDLHHSLFSNGQSQSQGYYSSRKDHTRTPRGQAGEGRNNLAHAGWDSRYDERAYERERSRSPMRESRGNYIDRDQEGYTSPRRDRSRSPLRGTPNRNIILEGLPMNWTQEDILNELKHNLNVEGIEEIRLIKDKRTGLSRRFAFAQFIDIPKARQFIELYYPTLIVHDNSQEPGSESLKVRIAYSKEARERDGKGEDDWKCEICYLANFAHRVLCFRCNAPRTRATINGVLVAQMSSFSGFATTGDSDVSLDGTASQFLLVRGLEPGVTEELLAKGVSKLYKTKTKTSTPPTNVPAAKKTKISSTTNDASLGAKEGSLRRVLLVRDRKSNDSWRYGFAEFNTVEDAQAAMVKYNSSDKFTISSKPVMISYIHSGVFVPVLNLVEEKASRYMFSPLSNAAVKLSYWDQAAYASEHATAVTIRTSAGRSKELEHVRLAAAAANEEHLGPGKDGEPRLKKRKTEKESKPVAPHLQFWTNRHAELHGQVSKDINDISTTAIAHSHAKPSQLAFQDPPSMSFADLDRKCCLLCSRQFKGAADINKHERMSQLHRDNLKNEDLVKKALAKLNRMTKSTAENSAYRDRAKERRQAFNQPKQPAAQHNRASKEESKTEEEFVVPAPSKGAALLGKMGWSVGEGLGAQGTGRTEAIKTELYSQGVGLGAQGGRVGDAAEEAQKQTKNNSYADFVSNVKDRAKERFDSLK